MDRGWRLNLEKKPTRIKNHIHGTCCKKQTHSTALALLLLPHTYQTQLSPVPVVLSVSLDTKAYSASVPKGSDSASATGPAAGVAAAGMAGATAAAAGDAAAGDAAAGDAAAGMAGCPPAPVGTPTLAAGNPRNDQPKAGPGAGVHGLLAARGTAAGTAVGAAGTAVGAAPGLVWVNDHPGTAAAARPIAGVGEANAPGPTGHAACTGGAWEDTCTGANPLLVEENGQPVVTAGVGVAPTLTAGEPNGAWVDTCTGANPLLVEENGQPVIAAGAGVAPTLTAGEPTGAWVDTCTGANPLLVEENGHPVIAAGAACAAGASVAPTLTAGEPNDVWVDTCTGANPLLVGEKGHPATAAGAAETGFGPALPVVHPNGADAVAGDAGSGAVGAPDAGVRDAVASGANADDANGQALPLPMPAVAGLPGGALIASQGPVRRKKVTWKIREKPRALSPVFFFLLGQKVTHFVQSWMENRSAWDAWSS